MRVCMDECICACVCMHMHIHVCVRVYMYNTLGKMASLQGFA